VYAKRAFGSPTSVIEYLGRYTHKIAISNHRIKEIDNQNITFSYKDYKIGGQHKLITLTHQEFIRRFAQHILPKRLVKIRHYGFLSSSWKRKKLKVLQQKMIVVVQVKTELTTKLKICGCCKIGKLITLLAFDKRGPPKNHLLDNKTSFSC
jgi:hypothetical protein